jgi:hypothetical protein
MKVIHLKRKAVLAGLIGVAAFGAAMLAPTAAQANVPNPPTGSQPGNLQAVPDHGASTLVPTFQTTTACPAGFQATANLTAWDDAGIQQNLSAGVPSTLTGSPFSVVPSASMADILSVLSPEGSGAGVGNGGGETFEFVIQCNASLTSFENVQSTFVTFSADTLSWTSSATPPGGGGSGPVATTTTLNASPTTALEGNDVTLTATVAGAGAAGNVEFFDDTTSLGVQPLAAGKAVDTINTLAIGDHPITAKFEPTDATAFSGSTSAVQTVHVVANNGDTGSETINVNVPLQEGVFTMTVSPDAVNLTQAQNDGTKFESTGDLSPVTVSDGRQQSIPGWSVSGQVSDFTAGALSFNGDDLGWKPAVTTQDPAGDVVAGDQIAAGANPGLKEGGKLASAPAGAGIGSSTLGAALDLQVPVTTKPGDYTATLTVTAVESAS